MRKISLVLAALVLPAVLVGHTRPKAPLDPTPEPPHLAMLPYVARDLAPEPKPDPEVAVYDCDDQPADATWLYETFGAVAWQPRDGARLVALRSREGPATLVIHVEDGAGDPLENVTVVRHWPDAPPLPAELQWDGTYNRGVFGPTNGEGNIGFGMGFGDYYFPPGQSGASAVWIGGPASYLLTGLGMLGGTNHMHLDSDWVLSTAQAQALQAQNWRFSPGAVVRYEDLGYGEPVAVVSPTNPHTDALPK
jgi:hypothetical protein